MRLWWILVVLCGQTYLAEAQSAADETFRVYTESPRLLLRAQRLRLLRRESERKSMRWEQFHALAGGAARMPEPGMALGLEAMVTGDAGTTRQAIEWAVAPAANVRQTALVYDWLRGSLSPAQAKTLEAKLTRAAQTAGDGTYAATRDRVFAAIAVGDTAPDVAEKALQTVVADWWRRQTAPKLQKSSLLPAKDLYALFELMHAVRDNLNIDLRENATDFFKALPGLYLLGHYPAPYPAAENDYRIPAFKGPGEPDMEDAMFSRAAGLSMVAYDNNSQDSQFLQGWLLMDHFILKHALAAPYEYLWANPYQPGLSYYHFPLSYHSEKSGGLFLRSSWEDDANWFGIVGGQLQLYADGKITLVNTKLKQAALEFGPAMLVIGPEAEKFEVETDKEKQGTVYIAGLEPGKRYNVEADDEEMWDVLADPAGTVSISVPAGVKTVYRVSKAMPVTP